MSYVDTSSLKNSTIMLLYSERSEINMSPEYQRMGGVWTSEKRRLLIDSILNDYDLPKIYFHVLGQDEVHKSGFRFAVIDGRQRLEAIWGFMNGDFTLASDFEYQRDAQLNLGGLSYEDIAKQYPKIRVKFDSFVLPVVTVVIEGDDIDLIEDMFSRLNEAVPLNAAEKRNAIGGDVVRAITDVSQHIFFHSRVKFRNNRYQHREAAARFLLVEDSLNTSGQIVDTKKVYLDSLAKRYHDGYSARVDKLKADVTNVLNRMAAEFAAGDELLHAQGILVVYYLIFRSAVIYGEEAKITRRSLLDFRQKLAVNREAAIKNYEGASFDLLEFDRLNQQGTNDASSIKERVKILSEFLGVTLQKI
ncbi:DUF262 domain-containing protein [Xanthomonas hortorum pv. cynarae]|uniref:DUF262 domain-containing protein n=1 Tax=Xanthomonas hortorum TaxID=56454 RepID=UPI000CEE68ED|nr:DUF262 domain-containing protein [Xanthomonas hortorum]MCE4351174.1 DUF262 domain-containing protein [Xanthomonas hortorum pv. cynarae]PPU38327.1 hypothetical protein XcyCFBP4188_18630 [Xanthomonas hortorum pv. cynarae]CAD0306297.1 hypothetical protein CFBP2044_07150 [Xanthomonas hortorum pv. cynarae]CAD0306304.1 hypothetical protein CFBP2044_07150 [Xanthomonas hortorum pv. cynarae]